MQGFQLWKTDVFYKKIRLINPKLASWNANSDPAQIAVQRYCDDIEKELGSLLSNSDLSLCMEIDVKDQKHLLHQHDLDNYLYPVVKKLGANRFTLIRAIKRIGGGSFLSIGSTAFSHTSFPKEEWISFQHDTRGVSKDKPKWKEDIRNALKEAIESQKIYPLKPGPVALQLTLRCSSATNWINLWKPAIDAMGPVLGEPDPQRPFHPNDDRIVSLTIHRNTDDSIRWSVHMNMAWRNLSVSG